MKIWDKQSFSPGEIVFFGINQRTDQPKKWIILKVFEKDHTALLSSLESAGTVPYHSNSREQVSWADCSLRKWLNSDYLSDFRTADFHAIRKNHTPASESGSETVEDDVFILSREEAGDLFEDDAERTLHDESADQRYRLPWESWREPSRWWLRADAVYDDMRNETMVPVCDEKGNLDNCRSVSTRKNGVRPCMWVQQSALRKTQELELEYLNIRLLEKSREDYVSFHEGGEVSNQILAEYMDYDTQKRYAILLNEGGPYVAEVLLKENTDALVEEKAKVLGSLLNRRSYREVMGMTQRKLDEKEFLASLIQPAWMPTSGTAYPQIDDSGKYGIRLGSYEGESLYWRVIMRNGNKAMCLCETGLKHDTFMESEDLEPCWEYSRIRHWLNEIFYNEAFSESEKKRIQCVRTRKESMKAPAVYDCVFLLSAAEANCLLPTRTERIMSESLDRYFESEEYEWGSVQPGDWWLRTPGLEQENFCLIHRDGTIDRKGAWGQFTVCAVRPAVLVELVEPEIEYVERE